MSPTMVMTIMKFLFVILVISIFSLMIGLTIGTILKAFTIIGGVALLILLITWIIHITPEKFRGGWVVLIRYHATKLRQEYNLISPIDRILLIGMIVLSLFLLLVGIKGGLLATTI